jgi:predicted SAM-dependent methyltransferase
MGVDAEPIKIEIASGDYPRDGYIHVDCRLGLPHQDCQADIADLPFRDNSIDEILGVAIIEHIPHASIHAVMRELRRVLKVGGMLKLYTFNLLQVCQRILDEAAPIGELVSNLYGGHDYPENVHHYAYTPGSLRQLFELCDFEIVYVQQDNGLYMEGRNT